MSWPPPGVRSWTQTPGSPFKGLSFKRTSKGWACLFVHWSADPTKSTAWAEQEFAKYSSPAWWNQEMEGWDDALQGALVYPEFSDVHIIHPEFIPKRGCIYSAGDPHPRTPHAWLWVLIDKYSDWYIYRELWPSVVYGEPRNLKDTDVENHFTVREYADTIARLEGNRIEFLYPETDMEYGVYRETSRGERIVDRFMDQAAKGFRTSDERQKKEETIASRYSKYGLVCKDPIKLHRVGEDAVKDLLKLRHHNVYNLWPRLHIASDCVETIYEFQNYRYPQESRPDRELKQEGVQVRCHMLDLMRYLACADIGYYPSMESERYCGGLA